MQPKDLNACELNIYNKGKEDGLAEAALREKELRQQSDQKEVEPGIMRGFIEKEYVVKLKLFDADFDGKGFIHDHLLKMDTDSAKLLSVDDLK